MSALTEREKWLMCKAFQQGYGRGHNDTVEACYYPPCAEESDCFYDWVNDFAADGITVGDELSRLAPSIKGGDAE